jgi:predicted transposase YbfD/YdcC
MAKEPLTGAPKTRLTRAKKKSLTGVKKKPLAGVKNVVAEHNSIVETSSIATAFATIVEREVHDPRSRECTYPLVEILFVALVSTICEGESNQDFATFGATQLNWLRNFFPFANGTPSHDTFRNVFRLLKTSALLAAYGELIDGLRMDKNGNHLALDGKALRGCRGKNGVSWLRMVTVYDTDAGIAIAQLPSRDDEDGKEQGELTAMLQIIPTLNLSGALVTVDACGCYAEVASATRASGGDFALALKDNQPKLLSRTLELFAERSEAATVYRDESRGHGRDEVREYFALPASGLESKWSSVRTLVKGIFTTTSQGKTTVSERYFISSLSSAEVERIGRALRGHWGIENGLHWCLDVTFKEDGNRTRRGNGAGNLSLLRRLSLAILRGLKRKESLPALRYRAAFDEEFRSQILAKSFMR